MMISGRQVPPRTAAADLLAATRSGLLLGPAAAAVVVSVSLADGGYFPTDWRWAEFVLLCGCAIALLVRERIELSRLGVAAFATLAMLTLWTRVSAAWSSVPPTSELEGERGLVYVAGLLVVLLAVEPEAVCHVVGGMVAGIAVVSTYALADYASSSPTLHPLPLLNGPLGYANALGVLAAMGIVLGVGLGFRARSPSLRLFLALTCLPMLAALIMTQSRGAVGAAAVGIMVTLAAASHSRLRLGVGAVSVLSAGLVLGVVFVSSTPGKALADLPGNNRWDYWHIAWQDYLAHPLLGSGAGSFGDYWTRHAPIPSGALDAHNLYLEALAELGPIGLALTVAVVVIPLAAALNLGGTASGAVGAFVTFAVHAAVDWDWEMPAVTLTAIFLAGLLLVPLRRGEAQIVLGPLLRVALLAGTIAFAILALVQLAVWSSV